MVVAIGKGFLSYQSINNVGISWFSDFNSFRLNCMLFVGEQHMYIHFTRIWKFNRDYKFRVQFDMEDVQVDIIKLLTKLSGKLSQFGITNYQNMYSLALLLDYIIKTIYSILDIVGK